MRPLATERLVIRNWENRDRALFHRINSDPEVMRFFPSRRNRAEADSLLDRLSASIADRGYGFTAIEQRETGECLGFAGLSDVDLEPQVAAGSVEIGWRLAPEHWGHGYASEAAGELLRFGFETLGLEEIVSFAVFDNFRSIAVMRRIGMTPDPQRDFDHPRVPDDQPLLKRHVFHCITRAAWRARNGRR